MLKKWTSWNFRGCNPGLVFGVMVSVCFFFENFLSVCMLELVRRKSNALLLWGITSVYESQSVYTCTCGSQYVHRHVCFDMLSFCQACGLLMWYVCLWIFVWYDILTYLYLAWIDSVPCIAWTEFYSIKVTSVSLKSWTDEQKVQLDCSGVALVSTMFVVYISNFCCILH